MKPVRFCAILAVPLLAVACSQAPGNNSSATANAAASANETAPAAPANSAAAESAPANAAAPAAAGPLSAYVGKTTYDPVDGTAFVDRPEVRAAVDALVPDAAARRWILSRDTTQSPIAMQSGKLYSSACEPHNCGPHQWTILIAPDGSSAEICYHDDRQDPAHSRWYAAGRAPETRPGYCTPV
jgi:hypothetical protein